MIEINKIFNEDCLETLKRMEDNSIDLIVTSPPYNKGWYANKNAKQSKVWDNLKGRAIGYDSYSDNMNPSDYEQWQTKVLSECMRVLKPSGSIFYNHKDILYKGLTVTPKWVYQFPLKQHIIWDRQSSCMIDPHYFMPANEWIYWIVKDPKKTFFDKEKSFYKTNIWRVNVESNPHPAPFPQKLVNSMVASCCPEAGIVYDPFMGSGTTAKVARALKRNYIGFEISQEYVDKANKRMQDTMTLFD